jgi:hypothetical protein
MRSEIRCENTGHVKAVAEMTGKNLDHQVGRAVAADGATSIPMTTGKASKMKATWKAGRWNPTTLVDA